MDWLDRGFYHEGGALLHHYSSTGRRGELDTLARRGVNWAGRFDRDPGALVGTSIGTQGALAESRACLEEAVAIYRQMGDEHGLATALDWRTQMGGHYGDVLPDVYGPEAAALYAKVH